MRIVHLSDGYLPRPGGIEHHVRDLAVRQAAEGHDVTVVTTTPGPSPEDAGIAVARPDWPASATPSHGMQHTWVGRALGRPDLARADVAHVHTSTLSPLAFAAIASLPRRGVPVVVTMHSMVAHARPVLAAADTVLGWSRHPVEWTAVSSAAAADLARVLGPARPVAVLPNGIDPACWPPHRRTRAPGRLVVVSAGRLVGRKRPRALLAMLRDARARIDTSIRVELVLAGDGPDRPALDRFVGRHRMRDWVTLTGPRTRAQLAEIYRAADLYVAPAPLESFGLAALEPRCSGLPVIAHSDSGVADFVTHGTDGFLTRSDAATVDALTTMAESPGLHDRMLAVAAASTPRFGWDEVLPATFAAYDRAAAPAGSARR